MGTYSHFTSFFAHYQKTNKLVLTPKSVGNQLNFLFFSITKKITKRVFYWVDRLGADRLGDALFQKRIWGQDVNLSFPKEQKTV